MKTDLELLIKHLEKEKKKLELEIKNCISEWDYQSASYLSKGLSRLNRKLQTLAELDNTNKLKIKQQKKALKKMKKAFKKKKYENLKIDGKSDFNKKMSKLYKKQKNRIIDGKKDFIKKLKTEPQKDYIDGQIIDEAIITLLNNEIVDYPQKTEQQVKFDKILNL